LEKEIVERKRTEESLKQRTQALEQTQKKLEENACLLEEYANQMEELAKIRLEKLKDTERLAAIGATAGMVGHDIRNPLQAITSDLYLVKSEVSVLAESEQKNAILESLEETERNVDYINKIVQDLQDYARPLNPNVEISDIKEIVEKLIAKNGIPKNVKVTIEVADKARKIFADSYYLNRILSNLISNAVQAMPEGGTLTIRSTNTSKKVLICVEDTGMGIPDEIKPKLFSPMVTTKSKGQGLGLAVVKRLVETLSGTVTFESKLGQGTKFTVCLPKNK
jgi:signal transduction histidine kinase